MLTRDERGAVLGGAPLAEILGAAASAGAGTPAYVYDLDGIQAEARALREGFGSAPHFVAYAVKANTAGPIVRALGRAGCGAEVVSGGELQVALGCGIDPATGRRRSRRRGASSSSPTRSRPRPVSAAG